MAAAEDRAAWLDARRLGIGGSDVAAVLGVSRWRSPHDVWRDKTGRDEPDREPSPAMVRGTVVEAALRAAYEADHGETLERPAIVIGGEPWQRYSPDGILVRDRLLWEGKTSAEWDEWSDCDAETDTRHNDLMPADYAWQVAHGLEVCDCDVVHLSAALVPRSADDMVAEGLAAGVPEMAIGRMILAASEVRHYRVTRDRDLGAALEEKLGAWWQRHVVEDEEPDVTSTAATEAWLIRRSPQTLGPLRPATADEAALVSQWEGAAGAKKAAEKLADDFAARVKEAIGEAQGIQTDRGRVTWAWQAGSTFTVTRKPTRVLRKSWK